jgi:PLP dependent protein
LRELRQACGERLGAPLPHLSMGMSGDFDAAIEEGATIVRIGTALFGERVYKPRASAED